MTATPTRDPEPSEADFPRDASPAERIHFALRYAVLAPSSHNTQPWLFRVEGARVEVIADRTRALPVVDPDDRELVISCGASLHHLRTALAAFGETFSVEVMPDDASPDVVARITLSEQGDPQPLASAHLACMGRRMTTRFPFLYEPIPTEKLDDLQQAAENQGARLLFSTGAERHALAELVAQGDRQQMADKSFRRELASWMHGNRSRHRDGMPGYAHGFGDVIASLGPFVVRTFDLGQSQAAKDVALADGSPVLALLGTNGDGPADWLHAGEALSALLLEATLLGLSASFLNQPIEVQSLREKLASALMPDAHPQILLRLGTHAGPPPRPTPRRPLADVLVGAR